MDQVIDFSTLTWVKAELDATLQEARQALEGHVERPQDKAQLESVVALLHQATGTLQMVELYGAALLVEEMEQLTAAIGGESVAQHDDACDVLMRAMLQLPDYLDRLLSGCRDIPLVLLPLLNDLRAVRGEPLLSENAMFTPDLNAVLPESLLTHPVGVDVREEARELRHLFQVGLLGWLRGVNAEASLKKLLQAVEGLQGLAGHDHVARLWWVAAGLIETLLSGELNGGVALKRVLGQVDREIKRLLDEGETALIDDPREDLLKNLLFYCAQSDAPASSRVAEIQSLYHLKELLPDEVELATVSESLTGQNSDLFKTVADAVKDETARLRDTLDMLLRNGCSSNEELHPLHIALQSLADTLGMLSLGAARKAVLNKVSGLQVCMESGDAPADTLLMDLAGTLLFVESAVDGMGNGRAVADEEVSVEEELAANEYQSVMSVVVNEAIVDLVHAKEAIVDYIESDHDTAHLANVPQWFIQVKGGLSLLGESRSASLVDSIVCYINNELIKKRKKASAHELDSLADAVCGLEYYLEGRKERRMYGSAAMSVAEQGIKNLGYPIIETDVDSKPGAKADEVAAGDAPATADADISERRFEFDYSLLDESTVATDASAAGIGSHDRVVDPGDEALRPVQTPGFDDQNELSPAIVVDREDTDTGIQIPDAAVADEVGTFEPDVDDGLAIIGDDVDDEILEIFIEEAEEELASINQQLPVWQSDSEHLDSLGSIRRSYHTLKGSGRLVGAMRIGEFGWAFENLLNRLIDGTVTVTPDLTTLMQAATEALTELVGQVKDGTPTTAPIAYLMHCAEAMSRGEAIPQHTVGSPLTESPDQAGPEEDVEAASVSRSSPETVDDYEDSGQEHTRSAAESDEEQFDQESSAHIIEEEKLPGGTGPGDDGPMDLLLYEIFNTESRAHLEVVRDYLEHVVSDETMISEALARALHTIHGSAHMADAHAIAELAGGLEKLLKILFSAELAISEDIRTLLEQSMRAIEQMLSGLPEQRALPPDYEEILRRVQEQCELVMAADYYAAAMEFAENEDTDTPTSSEQTGNEQLADDSVDDVLMEFAEDEGVVTPSSPESGGDEQLADDSVGDERETDSVTDYYAACDNELLEIFLEESDENIETADAALKIWRESPDDDEALADLQRALHTLKGGARMADVGVIGDVAHATESLISTISDGCYPCRNEAMDGVQKAQDYLAEMLQHVRNREALEPADGLIETLDTLRTTVLATENDSAGEQGQPAPGANPASAVDVADADSNDPYSEIDSEILQIFLEEAGDIIEHCEQTLQSWKRSPTERQLMAELQRELHTLKGGARMADITEIGDLAHAVESFMVKIAEAETTCSERGFAVLQQAQDELAGMIEKVHDRRILQPAEAIIAEFERLRSGQDSQTPTDVASAAETGCSATDNGTDFGDRRARSRVSQELVRVKAELLDNMVNYAGEVSIYRSRLEQQIGAYGFNLVEMDQTVARVREQLRKLEIETDAQVLYRYEREGEVIGGEADGADFDPLEMDRYSHIQQLSRSLMESVSDLTSIQSLLENITRESETLLLQQARVNTELQEGLMHTRMVPFLGLAARMRRIVRQTAQEVGKKVELELSGAEGEMDRTVVDRIVAPIEHMLRNAISHGIELPQERLQKGKRETGTIRITLQRESSDVVLKIADDGAGINLNAIRKKALERGLMQDGAELTDNEILQFILETGFSTAERITQVAGRGVGMDVVNNEVKQLGGSLQIDSSQDKGTSFTVRLPFTLALNQALLIEVGEDTYAIPLSSIEGIVRMRREELKAYYNDPEARFEYGGHSYEVQHLGTALGTGTPHLDNGPKRIPALLARVGKHCVAFQVENLLGSREIVVKSVGPQISTVRGLSGATILGDGRVVMILDIAALLRGGFTNLDQIKGIIDQPARAHGLTVMVVDDSITVRKVTARLLERNDMNVITAKDGVDAVSKLQDNIPDMMLLDIEMPRMDGFELATHVRNEPRLRDIPIIMITSRTGDKHRQRAMQIGVNRYLGKPFQESELVENIQSLLAELKADG